MISSHPTSAEDLRRMFNELGIEQKVQKGEFQVLVKKSNHPAKTKANEPFCTQSQLIYYYDRLGDVVATAHRYLRTDGTLGASGLPDPKKVYYRGRHYHLQL